MDVDREIATAEAQLALAKATKKFLEAKAKFHAIDRDERTDAQRKAYHKAQQDFVKVRDNWKINFRTAPNGPGDATVSPASHTVGVK